MCKWVGQFVRVRPNVKLPRYGWGQVKPQSVGVLHDVNGEHAYVDFTPQSRWHCLLDELEIDPIIKGLRKGVSVRIRAGTVNPTHGWGALRRCGVGEVVLVAEGRVFVQGLGFVGAYHLEELEPIEDNAPKESLEDAIARLQRNDKDLLERRGTVGLLLTLLNSCGHKDVSTVRLPSTAHQAVFEVYAAVDVLTAAGLQGVERLAHGIRFRSPAQFKASSRRRARAASKTLQEAFPKVEPLPLSRYQWRVTVTIAEAHAPAEPTQAAFDKIWSEFLKDTVIPSIAPSTEQWTWGDRGWRSEKDLLDCMAKDFLAGDCMTCCKGQTKAEAEIVAKRLRSNRLNIDVVLSGETINFRRESWAENLSDDENDESPAATSHADTGRTSDSSFMRDVSELAKHSVSQMSIGAKNSVAR